MTRLETIRGTEKRESLENPIDPPTHTALTAAEWRRIVAAQPLWLEVTSDSMQPTLRLGDQVRVQPATGWPEAGAVLVFVQNGCLTAHRHLGNGRCRGDNCLRIDPPVAADGIVGIVTARKRDGDVCPVPGIPWWSGCRLRLRAIVRRLVLMKDEG